MSQIHLRFGLRSRIAAALGLTSVGTAAVLLAGSLWIVSGLIGQADLRELRGHYDAFQSLIEQEARTATAMSSVVASMPPVQQAMAHGDRAALMSFFGAGFAGLKADFGVEQFQFHTAPATAFLRVHMPEKSGDDLSGFRKTVVNANARNKAVFGLEGGVAGSASAAWCRSILPISSWYGRVRSVLWPGVLRPVQAPARHRYSVSPARQGNVPHIRRNLE